jgi:hypothetical protein
VNRNCVCTRSGSLTTTIVSKVIAKRVDKADFDVGTTQGHPESSYTGSGKWPGDFLYWVYGTGSKHFYIMYRACVTWPGHFYVILGTCHIARGFLRYPGHVSHGPGILCYTGHVSHCPGIFMLFWACHMARAFLLYRACVTWPGHFYVILGMCHMARAFQCYTECLSHGPGIFMFSWLYVKWPMYFNVVPGICTLPGDFNVIP